MTKPDTHRFADDGRFPNSVLPLIVHRNALPADAAAIERRFAANGWSNAWRDGIFRFHHFHSISHEVLGIAAGSVRVRFGGPSGEVLTLAPGDVVVIPAGVAHCNAGQTDDLLVVGAYPGGSDYDIRRGDPAEHAAAVQAISAVPLPANDPVQGSYGAIAELWAPQGPNGATGVKTHF